MLPVCRQIRASRHKVAKGLAQWGKNSSGWHYGFKLHMSINMSNEVCAFAFSDASKYDGQYMSKLVNPLTDILVGDSHYGGAIQRRYLWHEFKTKVIAPPHFSQKTKLAPLSDLNLLKKRPKIEAVFGILKEKLNLVTSYPRSIRGYFLHYIRIILGYQVSMLIS